MKTDKDDLKADLLFGWNVHAYLIDQIKFCDTKAGVCLASLAGLFTVLFNSGIHKYCHPGRVTIEGALWIPTSYGVASSAIFLTMLVSTYFLARAIMPQLKAGGPPLGLVFWRGIVTLKHGEFTDKAHAMTVPEQLTEVTNHNYQLARVADAKYTNLKWGMRTLSRAIPAALLLLFLSK